MAQQRKIRTSGVSIAAAACVCMGSLLVVADGAVTDESWWMNHRMRRHRGALGAAVAIAAVSALLLMAQALRVIAS